MSDRVEGHAGTATRIDGVSFGRLVRHADARGSLREVWRASWYAGTNIRFEQANISTSAAGVLRGLHLHRRQVDHWAIVDGGGVVALVDIRPMLDGAERPVVETHPIEVDDRLTIPPGVAHGFLALEPLTLLYVVSAEFDGTDELGFAWDDPTAAVPWPKVPATADGRPILSDRDRSNPPLPEVVDRLR